MAWDVHKLQQTNPDLKTKSLQTDSAAWIQVILWCEGDSEDLWDQFHHRPVYCMCLRMPSRLYLLIKSFLKHLKSHKNHCNVLSFSLISGCRAINLIKVFMINHSVSLELAYIFKQFYMLPLCASYTLITFVLCTNVNCNNSHFPF